MEILSMPVLTNLWAFCSEKTLGCGPFGAMITNDEVLNSFVKTNMVVVFGNKATSRGGAIIFRSIFVLTKEFST